MSYLQPLRQSAYVLADYQPIRGIRHAEKKEAGCAGAGETAGAEDCGPDPEEATDDAACCA
jgi:hypothetical protein